MQVQRLGGLDARLISYRKKDHPRRAYPHDLLTSDDPALLVQVLEEADVLHYHNWWDRCLLEDHPWMWERIARKTAVLQFHSPRSEQYEDILRQPALVKLVVAQYQVRQYPECRPVPNALPIDDALHRPAGAENEPPVVAYTPSHCEDLPDWDNKGCGITLEVLRDGFRYVVVTDTPWEETMRIRRRCDVAIDEVVTGSYHLCSLESLSQGLATVAGLDAETVDALERLTGTREHPWIVATPETLRERLTELMEDGAYRRAKRQEARAYMERHWSPGAIARTFEAIYAEALERGSVVNRQP
jgi:hypothetical protein